MHAIISRREFVKKTATGLAGVSCGAAALAAATKENAPSITIIDTHTHFYDPGRPQGVPWPGKNDKVLYRTVRPADYQALPKPQPVTGTVVVEASPWLEDNQWILDLAAKEPFIKGFVGSLPVGTEEFKSHLLRFSANPLFRGIRARPSPAARRFEEPRFIADLKLLADRDLSLDLVGREIREFIPRLAQTIPSLRIVIDHLAGVRIDGKAPEADWLQAMRTAARHKNVFAKVSGLVEGSGQSGGNAPRDTAYYQPTLDVMWDLFGEDRLVYGSNWPVCELFSDLATVQRIVTEYFTPKGDRVLEKVFWRNAQRAYQWVSR